MREYKKAVTFSYDDGITYDKRLIEIFNKYRIKATFNICTGTEKKETAKGWKTSKGVLVKRNDFSQAENVRMYKGHEVALHTRNHYFLNELDDIKLKTEILGNKTDLEEMFGGSMVGIAYPFNSFDDRAVNLLKENGFLYGREGHENHSFDLQKDLLRFKPTCHHNDAAVFDLAREFVNMKCGSLKIFYVWGHSYEFENDDNWDRIERLCKFLSGRDDIFFGTNREVFELQKKSEMDC